MKKYRFYNKIVVPCLCLAAFLSITGCATYHQKNIKFHQEIAHGNFDAAVAYWNQNKGDSKGRNRLIYYMELGTAYHLASQYSESNQAFEKAYIILEEFTKNFALDAVSFITNPAVVPYPGEDFEKVQIHYYKALNFALMGNYNDALVECRRINIKLNILNDRYETGKKNHYGSDAFAWNFMGILHDAVGEYNNAFICYRNALETYKKNYLPDYGINPPNQLKLDLLNAAWRTGLKEELAYYKKQLHVDWTPPENDGNSTTDLVIFWNNGLGPYKTEQSINFFLDKGDAGLVTFVNKENNFAIPVPVGGQDTNSFKDLSLIRMALPDYITRTPYYNSAEIKLDSNTTVPLETAQDINAIAQLNLQDRMGRELGKALLRLAIKQAIEHAVRKEDKGLGTVVSIINAISEKADTRNWQTLPFAICYARVKIPSGTNQITIEKVTWNGSRQSSILPVNESPGKTQFIVVNDPYVRDKF